MLDTRYEHKSRDTVDIHQITNRSNIALVAMIRSIRTYITNYTYILFEPLFILLILFIHTVSNNVIESNYARSVCFAQ